MSIEDTRIERPVVFGTVQIPFSSDPLDFDYYTHHYAFSSVFSKLVSTEKANEVFPMLASEWSHDGLFKIWKFKIRKDLLYSNNDMIKIEDIVLNFKRLSYLKNKNNSKSGMLEFLEGFYDFKDMSKAHPGIVGDESYLIFKFTKPMPDLLSIISFGFYGLAHPSLYDHISGSWLDKNASISSGTYEVTKWDNDNFDLKFRENNKYISSVNRLLNIKFKLITKVKNSKELEEIDLFAADKNSLLVDENFEYSGSNENFKIGYVKCNAWDKENSELNRLEVRKWFRSKFYEGLRNNNFPITYSFFPLNITGVVDPTVSDKIFKPDFPPFNIVTHPILSSAKLKENEGKKSIAEFFSDALQNLGQNSGATLIQKELSNDSLYDVYISGTGIESVDYWETVRFMFLSKEGIRLPDSSGKIIEEIAKINPDINIINQEIWDQAIIWPIRHYSSGYWFNKKAKINFDEMNFESTSIDFQFLKWE